LLPPKWRIIFDELRPIFAYAEFGSFSILLAAIIYSFNPVWFYVPRRPQPINSVFFPRPVLRAQATTALKRNVSINSLEPHRNSSIYQFPVKKENLPSIFRFSIYNRLIEAGWLSSDFSSNYLIIDQKPNFVYSRYLDVDAEFRGKEDIPRFSTFASFKIYKYPKRFYPYLGANLRRMNYSSTSSPFYFRSTSSNSVNNPIDFLALKNYKLIEFFDIPYKDSNYDPITRELNIKNIDTFAAIFEATEDDVVELPVESFVYFLSLHHGWFSSAPFEDREPLPYQRVKMLRDQSIPLVYDNQTYNRLMVMESSRIYRPRAILKHSYDWFSSSKRNYFSFFFNYETILLSGRVSNEVDNFLFTNKDYVRAQVGHVLGWKWDTTKIQPSGVAALLDVTAQPDIVDRENLDKFVYEARKDTSFLWRSKYYFDSFLFANTNLYANLKVLGKSYDSRVFYFNLFNRSVKKYYKNSFKKMYLKKRVINSYPFRNVKRMNESFRKKKQVYSSRLPKEPDFFFLDPDSARGAFPVESLQRTHKYAYGFSPKSIYYGHAPLEKLHRLSRVKFSYKKKKYQSFSFRKSAFKEMVYTHKPESHFFYDIRFNRERQFFPLMQAFNKDNIKWSGLTGHYRRYTMWTFLNENGYESYFEIPEEAPDPEREFYDEVEWQKAYYPESISFDPIHTFSNYREQNPYFKYYPKNFFFDFYEVLIRIGFWFTTSLFSRPYIRTVREYRNETYSLTDADIMVEVYFYVPSDVSSHSYTDFINAITRIPYFIFRKQNKIDLFNIRKDSSSVNIFQKTYWYIMKNWLLGRNSFSFNVRANRINSLIYRSPPLYPLKPANFYLNKNYSLLKMNFFGRLLNLDRIREKGYVRGRKPSFFYGRKDYKSLFFHKKLTIRSFFKRSPYLRFEKSSTNRLGQLYPFSNSSFKAMLEIANFSSIPDKKVSFQMATQRQANDSLSYYPRAVSFYSRYSHLKEAKSSGNLGKIVVHAFNEPTRLGENRYREKNISLYFGFLRHLKNFDFSAFDFDEIIPTNLPFNYSFSSSHFPFIDLFLNSMDVNKKLLDFSNSERIVHKVGFFGLIPLWRRNDNVKQLFVSPLIERNFYFSGRYPKFLLTFKSNKIFFEKFSAKFSFFNIAIKPAFQPSLVKRLALLNISKPLKTFSNTSVNNLIPSHFDIFLFKYPKTSLNFLLPNILKNQSFLEKNLYDF